MIHNVPHTSATAAAAAAQRSAPGSRRLPATPAPAADQPVHIDFSAIFGAAANARNVVASPASNPLATAVSATHIAPVAVTAPVANAAAASTTTTTTSTSTASTTTTTGATPAATTVKPGIQALITAIMNGSFKATNVTDPSKLQETTPWMTDTMPSFYYASDDTANQMAQLLGGKVVQMPAFGQNQGWSEPNANFIQLPNGQTFNAADVAYYARSGVQGPAQLTADITATINEGAMWTNYYKNGGQMPGFNTGWVGQPISGMDYPAGTIGADGNVINPVMQTSKTQGT